MQNYTISLMTLIPTSVCLSLINLIVCVALCAALCYNFAITVSEGLGYTKCVVNQQQLVYLYRIVAVQNAEYAALFLSTLYGQSNQ